MRTKRSTVTFNNTFKLKAFPNELPPGTYEISVADEETDTVLNQGWIRVSTMMCTPCIERQGGQTQWTGVNSAELEDALKLDARTVTLRSPPPLG